MLNDRATLGMAGPLLGCGRPTRPDNTSLTSPPEPSAPAGTLTRPPAGPGLGARDDDPGLVGEDDGLDAVTQAELGQDPADVDLDRALGQVQPGRDLAVGAPGGQLGEDGLLAAGELAQHRVPVRLLVRAGQQRGELVDEPPRRAGGEDRVTARHGPDGG